MTRMTHCMTSLPKPWSSTRVISRHIQKNSLSADKTYIVKRTRFFQIMFWDGHYQRFKSSVPSSTMAQVKKICFNYRQCELKIDRMSLLTLKFSKFTKRKFRNVENIICWLFKIPCRRHVETSVSRGISKEQNIDRKRRPSVRFSVEFACFLVCFLLFLHSNHTESWKMSLSPESTQEGWNLLSVGLAVTFVSRVSLVRMVIVDFRCARNAQFSEQQKKHANTRKPPEVSLLIGC